MPGTTEEASDSRSRRERNQKSAAKVDKFEQIRRMRAEQKKNKYQVGEVDNVYDYVPEDEYAKRVQERQQAEFIDSKGAPLDQEYYDDGREIFDDDEDSERFSAKAGKSTKKDKQKKKEAESSSRPAVKSADIRAMMAASAGSAKPKTKEMGMTKTNEILLANLLDKFSEDPPTEPERPSQFDILFAKDLPTITSRRRVLSRDSEFGNAQPASESPGFHQGHSDQRPRTPSPDFSVEGVSLLNISDRGAKRTFKESPIKVTESVLPSRPSVLAPKITTFSMDVPKSSTESAKKLKPGTPQKKADLSGDWDDWDGDAFTAQSIAHAENLSGATVTSASGSRLRAPFAHDGWTGFVGTAASESAEPENYDGLTKVAGERSFFWLDAQEDVSQKGCVFLFGILMDESQKLVHACVRVAGIMRKLYFCLREKRYDTMEDKLTDEIVDYEDLEAEFDCIRLKHRPKMANFRSKRLTKNYAFDKTEVPSETKCLEVQFPYDIETFPDNLVGETFVHVFGRNTTALENFLLDQKLKGPCWLNIKHANYAARPLSICPLEFCVERPLFVAVSEQQPEPPPVVVMAIHLRIVVNSKTKQNEIVGAAMLWNDKYPLKKAKRSDYWTGHKMLLSNPSDGGFPFGIRRMEVVVAELSKMVDTTVFKVEKDLLNALFDHVKNVDPDFLVFHDALGYQLEVILLRASHLRLPTWSHLGRLRRTVLPKGRFAPHVVTSGRLVVDVKRSAEELIHSKSYDLTDMVMDILGEKREDLDSDAIKAMYRNDEGLKTLIFHTVTDAKYVLLMMAQLDVIPLAVQITNIAGNVLSRTLLGGRSERNEFLLLHAFTERGYICPDKEWKDAYKKDGKEANKSKDHEGVKCESYAGEDEHPDAEAGPQVAAATSGKKKPAYTGGLVLDPKKGLHESYILLMDFNSLYPSIIQEYNICFTTMDRSCLVNFQEENLPDLPDSAERGVLPAEIGRLVEARRAVKSLIEKEQQERKRPDLLSQWDIRQKALKLTANSMYGCLGFANSRFFARPLAALITSQGREILKNTKQLVEKLGLEVIYGDTDSIMINTRLQDFDEVMKKGNEIRSKVRKIYKCLDLGVDGVFAKLLLLQKKKYAALVVKREKNEFKFEPELKGLDIVRRDWSELARVTGHYVVGQILALQKTEDMMEHIQTKLREVSSLVNLVSGAVTENDIKPFVITKQLTKDPTKYADARSQPHVQAALRWNQSSKNARQLTAGSTVPFVICNEAPPTAVVPTGANQRVPHTQRGYHKDEVLASKGSLTIDKQYYLAEQVHKVVNRLCEHVNGLDAALIAECLGVDRSLFPHHFTTPVEESSETAVVSDNELYKDCQPLLTKCSKCGERWEFGDPIWEKDGNYSWSFTKCPGCDEAILPHLFEIWNTLRSEIGRLIQYYYKPKFQCEEVSCHFRCSYVPPKFHRGHPVCPACNKSTMKAEFSERDLYLQLCYWRNAFDPARALENIKNKQVRDALETSLTTNSLDDNAVDNMQRVYSHMAGVVKQFMDRSAYGIIQLSDFFRPGIFEALRVKRIEKEEA